jgi:AcrR family transcriptional regulator
MENGSKNINGKPTAIARAALKLFSQKGYAFTSIEQIAAEAGIGKSTVYEYFSTKEELFKAAIGEAADGWIAQLEAIAAETRDPVERLRRVADIYLEHEDPDRHPEQRLFIEVLAQTLLQGGVFFGRDQFIRDIYQKILRIVVDYLLAGVSRGQLKPEIARSAEKLAINFLAYLDGILLHGMMMTDVIDTKEQVTLYISQLVPRISAAVADDAA